MGGMGICKSFGGACVGAVLFFSASAIAFAASVPLNGFVNFETPPLHSLDISPNGEFLAVCNTPDSRVELFSLLNGIPSPVASIPVGLDPVSVRFRSDLELWVVNHISDSVSIVDLGTGSVRATLPTLDEPYDVVFAGTPQRAFVSCSHPAKIMVFDPASLTSEPVQLGIQGEHPRAMTTSPDGSKVYVAIFESGNRSTVLGGGSDFFPFPPNVVSDSETPHGGMNPPLNGENNFVPPFNFEMGAFPPPVALIVKQDAEDFWRDDTGADWTPWVSGDHAEKSARPVGWKLLDNDVAVIDASTLDISYIEHMMNICMAIGVNPVTGDITVVGTDAINEVRFEPNVNGIFVQVKAAFADPDTLETSLVVDLNKNHVSSYAQPTLAASERAKSIGDPRGIVWNSDGTRGYVAGMGSNNIIVIDPTGERIGIADTIPVGEGPVGLAFDTLRNQLYVHNRFDGSVTVIDADTETETASVAYFDPTPPVIKTGRRHLYNTHETSGLGHVSCASCHVDARTDRMAWDLGDPSGDVVQLVDRVLNYNANNPELNEISELYHPFTDFHPMKGPMTTQTLQDIIGHEPLHWRGDRFGIEEFNGAFMALQGNDRVLTSEEMAEFKAFLATIHFPPNPYRALDNSLPSALDMDGHVTALGEPLPAGNAYEGLALFTLSGFPSCFNCHTFPTGAGTNHTWNADAGAWEPFPTGPRGESHLAVVSFDGRTERTFKVPQLRSFYRKVGMDMVRDISRAGFGFLNDGSNDTMGRSVANDNTQDLANITALLLSWSGSGFGIENDGANVNLPPGPPSKDAHAAVGKQATLASPEDSTAYLDQLMHIVENPQHFDTPGIELIAKGMRDGVMRGWLYLGGGIFQADEIGVTHNKEQLLASSGFGTETTFTVVPEGTGMRSGIDRDLDGYYDYDELQACSDAADAESTPLNNTCATEGEGGGEGEGLAEGEGFLEGEGNLAEGEGSSEEGEGTKPEGEGQSDGEGEPVWPSPHSGDLDGNFVFSLGELLRVVQLYNMGGYSCAPLLKAISSEDGYIAVPLGDTNCPPHNADYDPQDWQIDLSELLRVIQLYKFQGYHHCPGQAPDNYCPGTLEL